MGDPTIKLRKKEWNPPFYTFYSAGLQALRAEGIVDVTLTSKNDIGFLEFIYTHTIEEKN